jgi:hypothetical protein
VEATIVRRFVAVTKYLTNNLREGGFIVAQRFRGSSLYFWAVLILGL